MAEVFARAALKIGPGYRLHMTSGLMLAATPEQLDWMKSLLAKGKYAGGEAGLGRGSLRDDAAARSEAVRGATCG
jgi:hypothetical protein